MLMPRIFGKDIFDDFGGFPFSSFRTNEIMKTDIKDAGDNYELIMDMPGMNKDNIKVSLDDGYLTISASSNYSDDDQNDKYIRRERHYGSCSRSFYVGDAVTEDEIKASFENGALKLDIPKKENKPAVDGKKYIQIEG